MEPDRNPFGNHAWVEVQIENGQARQVLEICHAHVDLTNLANVTLCNADITRDKWIGRAVNVGLETNANIDNWKPIGKSKVQSSSVSKILPWREFIERPG